MDKNQKLLIVLAFLLGTALYFGMPLLKAVKKTENIPVKSVVDAQGLKQELMSLLAEEKDRRLNVHHVDWGNRDPFDVSRFKVAVKPDEPEVLEEADFVLLGVLWGGTKPSAIINGKIMGVGGIIEGMTVKEINEGRAVLSDGVHDKILTLQSYREKGPVL